MSFKTTIQPSNHTFPNGKDETILEAALEHGYTLPYSCRNGACGVCKGKVLHGSVDHGKAQPFMLSEEEKAAGLALFCCAKPLSDLTIESHEVTSSQEIAVKTLPCRVEKMVRHSEDVMALYLKIPATERLQFLAGQYIDILQKEGKPRSFSLANAPHDDELLELHVRNIAGGTFTNHVFTEMKERDILRIKGPLGTFYLHEDSPKPIIFVASGTGFRAGESDHRTCAAYRIQARDAFLLGRAHGVRFLHAEQGEGVGSARHQVHRGRFRRTVGRPQRIRASGRAGRLQGSVRLRGLCLRRTGGGGSRTPRVHYPARLAE